MRSAVGFNSFDLVVRRSDLILPEGSLMMSNPYIIYV